MTSADEAFDRKPVPWEITAKAMRDREILGWSERRFQDQVISTATAMGWLIYHTYDSRRSAPGFPDLVLLHPQRGLLFRELKRESGRVSKPQQVWINALAAAGADASVWRPADWVSGKVLEDLRNGVDR